MLYFLHSFAIIKYYKNGYKNMWKLLYEEYLSLWSEAEFICWNETISYLTQ
ncbi:MAG: hypothetical protein RHS_4548 [Robinsoniella sp. RHS]|nr:MAG: hypothetical protein RHS_4548 [Robinsoniella sp. RHS]